MPQSQILAQDLSNFLVSFVKRQYDGIHQAFSAIAVTGGITRDGWICQKKYIVVWIILVGNVFNVASQISLSAFLTPPSLKLVPPSLIWVIRALLKLASKIQQHHPHQAKSHRVWIIYHWESLSSTANQLKLQANLHNFRQSNSQHRQILSSVLSHGLTHPLAHQKCSLETIFPTGMAEAIEKEVEYSYLSPINMKVRNQRNWKRGNTVNWFGPKWRYKVQRTYT